MTDQEQFDAINTRQWYTDMRTQLATIMGAMQTNNFHVVAGGWVKTTVGGVPASFQLKDGGKVAKLRAGEAANGESIFEWDFPVGWLS